MKMETVDAQQIYNQLMSKPMALLTDEDLRVLRTVALELNSQQP